MVPFKFSIFESHSMSLCNISIYDVIFFLSLDVHAYMYIGMFNHFTINVVATCEKVTLS